MLINILKCQGSGNDFILIDEIQKNYNFTEDQRVMLTKELCDRNKTIGADGILFVQKSNIADAKMRIFNSDGTEPEMCGNGVRCVGRYICELTQKNEVVIETMKTTIMVKKAQNIYKNIETYEVSIEPVSFEPRSLPMNTEYNPHINLPIKGLYPDLKFTALSVPNPHIISLVDSIENSLIKIAEQVNKDKSTFPNGVNVSFVKVLDKNQIFALTYERGVGLTNSCGTAMSASSLVSCLLGITEYNSEINVYNNGGMVKCIVDRNDSDDYSVKLIGNATYVFTSTIDFDFNTPSNFTSFDGEAFINEISSYEEMVSEIKKYLLNKNSRKI